MEKKNKMKKIFKNLYIFSLICVFSSCEFFTDSFNAPVKEFFRDNTEAAAIELFEFSSETYENSITEKLTVSSLQDANVVLYLRNPREYNFITSENMTSTFGSFLHSEYYLVQDENDKKIINLTIPKELLEKIEIESRNNEYNKSQNILINLFHPVSKAEFVSFALEFDCDTIPPSVFSPVYYITTSSYPNSSMQNNYVIAFNMPKKSEVCSLGVHNDLEKLLIDETAYEVSIADDGTISFPNYPEIVSGNVEDATGIAALNAKFFVQDDYQPFYIVTNEELCSEGANATLSLVDKGNFSSKINISSNTRTLGKVSLKANGKSFTSETGVIEINQEENESYANITIIPPSVSVDLDGTEDDVSDVFVKYTLTNTNTNKVVTGSNNGSDSVTIDVPIGTYKLECISHKDSFADSVTTFERIQIKGSNFNLYVAESGDDSYLGTLSAPVKTIQEAVDRVIAMHKVTASSEGNPYKILLLSNIETSSTDSFENNALVNIDPSSASASENPLYLEISKYGDGNATINAKNTGRVMYIGEKANVTLKNLTLKGGYILNENGGGIYSKGNCKLNSCTISGNTANAPNRSVKGGGVYIESGSFTMEDCTISGNTAGSESSVANAYGGGIYGASGTNITMNDTTISENKVASINGVEGAGVCLYGANLTMQENSKISDNSCVSVYGPSFGGGVYVSDGTFSMEGDAVVDSSNDVYLKTGKTITISGELTFNGYVATITPENYAKNYEGNYEEVQVLAAGKNFALDKELVRKFEVTKYSDNVETIITETGCLKNTLTLGENPELTEDLYNICSTMNVSSADGMKAISNLSQTENGEKDFKGKTIILEKNVELDDTYTLIKTFSGVFEGNNKTITLTKPDIYDYDNYFGGAIFNVITGENAKVIDLNVSGEAYIAGIAIDLENDAVISNCTNSANITSPNGERVPGCGGIVGELSNGGKIENCINKGKIIGTRIVGGIVGAMGFISDNTNTFSRKHTIIANCANEGNVSVTGIRYNPNTLIGGICGSFNFGTIYNSYNTGDVTIDKNSSYSGNSTNTYENLGGIAGRCYYTNIEGIINCYNNGKISSESSSSTYTIETRIGGILGARIATTSGIITYPKFVNTVNNNDQIFSFGELEDQFDTTNTKDNYYKKNESSPNYRSYESTFANKETDVVEILNNYSDGKGRDYLEWKWTEDDGNIIFSEEIIGNQGITP